MLTPVEWDSILRSDARKTIAYAAVAKETHAYLTLLPEGKILSTNELVEVLYPREAAKTLTGDNARARIYRALADGAVGALNDCCTKGPAEGEAFGRPKRPWLWHKPKLRPICCMCGQVLPEGHNV